VQQEVSTDDRSKIIEESKDKKAVEIAIRKSELPKK
jgi:hypothetical protein